MFSMLVVALIASAAGPSPAVARTDAVVNVLQRQDGKMHLVCNAVVVGVHQEYATFVMPRSCGTNGTVIVQLPSVPNKFWMADVRSSNSKLTTIRTYIGEKHIDVPRQWTEPDTGAKVMVIGTTPAGGARMSGQVFKRQWSAFDDIPAREEFLLDIGPAKRHVAVGAGVFDDCGRLLGIVTGVGGVSVDHPGTNLIWIPWALLPL